jgi:regulatory protein
VPRYDTSPRIAKPLDSARLRELALVYVGRYATSRARLAAYLQRKVYERGWMENEQPADIEALVADFDRLGFVDDVAFASARARTLTARGIGLRRVAQELKIKGITEADGTDARDHAQDNRWQSADRFARRKRIGPYANEIAQPDLQQKQLQAFLRAGHDFDVAKAFVRAEPGEQMEMDD